MTFCFEDLSVGMELAPRTEGPITTLHMLRWSAAMENWHRVHTDFEFTVKHEGHRNLLVHGTLKQQFLMHFLHRWVRPHGWVWKLDYQLRQMTFPGEALTAWGRVIDLKHWGDFGTAKLEIGMRHADGSDCAPGTAVVALPLGAGPPLRYPFVPPADG